MKQQQGFTFLGILFTLACLIALGLLTVKVAPVYIENYSIKRSIDAMDRLTDIQTSTPEDDANLVKSRLMNQFNVNGLYHVDGKNLKVVPGKKENSFLITMNYKVLTPLFANISLLFDFHESQEITIDQK